MPHNAPERDSFADVSFPKSSQLLHGLFFPPWVLNPFSAPGSEHISVLDHTNNEEHQDVEQPWRCTTARPEDLVVQGLQREDFQGREATY